MSGIIFFILMLVQRFKGFVGDNWDVSTFLTSYIGIPIFLGLYFGHKFTRGKNDAWVTPSKEVDMTSGLDEIIANELPPRPREEWYRTWRAVFE